MMTINEIVLEKIREVNYRKWFPLLLAFILHVAVLNILLSILAMSYSLFCGHYDWTRAEFNQQLPYSLGSGMIFYQSPERAKYLYGVVFVIFCIGTWLFGTRVRLFSESIRRRSFSFFLCAAAVVLVVCFYSSKFIIPIGYDLLINIHDHFQSPYKDKLHRESVQLVAKVVLLLPYFIAFMVIAKLAGLYRDDEVIQKWFKEYSFQHKWLGRIGDEKAGTLADITLATRVDTGVPAILTGDSRQLGVTLLGPPGSGKTSMKIIKAFRQDMGHMQRMINDYPRLAKKYGIHSDKFKKAMSNHLIGSIIIEPAKDLCDSAYEVALQHGLPEELIIYLDPSNELTPGFNCMVGPLSQVAETITAVLDGMSEVSNEFFRQACRTVLKMYIYLIKIDRINNCNLLDLDRMYQDPRFAMDMVISVEKTIPLDADIQAMDKDQRLYWMLVKRVIRWFKNDALAVQTDRDGLIVRYPKGHEHEGREKVMDLQSEFTRQTRNLLSDLIMNPFLARILINDTSADIDRIMSRGGILLCNTDNGLLGDVSDAFGKLVLMTVQNAVFRRKGNEKTRSLVSLFVDEFYDYINRPFIKLASQGRKYKIAPFVAYQTLSQLAVKFDDKFVDVTLGTTRNLIVYGGVSNYDAEMLTKYFGNMSLDQLSTRESITPDAMQSPNYSFSETITREEVAVASEDDIMFNPFKFSYCRLVYEGSTKKAFLAEGDFIDKGEADKWEKKLDLEALKAYMNYWANEEYAEKELPVTEIVSIDEDLEEQVLEMTTLIEQDTKQLKMDKESNRFEGFSNKDAIALPTINQQHSERVQQVSILPNVAEANTNENKPKKSITSTPAPDRLDAREESFSFSKNMTGFMKSQKSPKEEAKFEDVNLSHGPENKMDQLKDVSIDEDENIQAFVRAVKARSDANRK